MGEEGPRVDLSVCDLSDACDELDVPAARTGVLKPLWNRCPALSGSLRTVRLEQATGAGSPLAELLDLLADSSGQILVVDLLGRTDVQCWGTVLAAAARRFGVVGALVNGAARDVEGLQTMGFPCYARGVFPASIRGRLRVSAIDQPVDLDGQTIVAGSFAAVDASGAVFLPAAEAPAVTELAVRRAQEERRLLQSLEAGADPRALFGGEEQ
jgi:4-hydroxy-4-methyl-2-oxoglutarate aldolase